MRNSSWAKGIALFVILLIVSVNWINGGEEVTSTQPTDQEIAEVYVFYKYGSEAGVKVYDEYSNGENIYYKVFDRDGHCVGSGHFNREEMVNELF